MNAERSSKELIYSTHKYFINPEFTSTTGEEQIGCVLKTTQLDFFKNVPHKQES